MPVADVFELTLATDCRISEVLGFAWEYTYLPAEDDQSGRLHIHQAVVRRVANVNLLIELIFGDLGEDFKYFSDRHSQTVSGIGTTAATMVRNHGSIHALKHLSYLGKGVAALELPPLCEAITQFMQRALTLPLKSLHVPACL